MENRNYAKCGNLDLLFKVQKERVIRESFFLSRKEIQEFRDEISPWINAGMISITKGLNPQDPPETEFFYSITNIGEEYLSEFQHYGF